MSKIAVTGLGIICCLGKGLESVWKKALKGKSCFQNASLNQFRSFQDHCVAQVRDRDLDEATDAHLSRVERLAVAAADEALKGFLCNGSKIGVAAGIGAAGMLEAEEWFADRIAANRRKNSRKIRGYPVSTLADCIAERFGLLGPRFSIATACSSSGVSLGLAADALEENEADGFLVVGGESLSLLTAAGFASLKSMDESVCRPFDLRRKGLILGEGAGAILLEPLEKARERGAEIYGILRGWGCSADAYHMTAPHPEGKGSVRAMEHALDDAGMDPGEIGYVNLHGTGTLLNDRAETAAMKAVFSDHARNMFFSSTKSLTGHCLGAAALIESVLSLLCLRSKTVLPTANYQVPDPQCDLGHVPKRPLHVPELTAVMNNTMAFGGNNASLIFSEVS